MDTIDREQLEEEIRSLGRQCRCRGYDGPCRFCLKADKLNNKLDRLVAEDEVVRRISRWLFANGHAAAAEALAIADARGELKESPVKAVDRP